MFGKIFKFIILAVVALSMACCKSTSSDKDVVKLEFDNDIPQFSEPDEGDEVAIVNTNMGTMKFRFFPEFAPKAVENFITHAKDGYYDSLLFHRVIYDFMIQGGDPRGTGTGGESIWGTPFEDEFHPQLRNLRGALSMANSGENTNGSQFFVVHQTYLHEQSKEDVNYSIQNSDSILGTDVDGNELKMSDFFPLALMEKYNEIGGAFHLDFKHTVFGMLYEGYEVLDEIAAVSTTGGTENKPLKDVIIKSIEIVPYSSSIE